MSIKIKQFIGKLYYQLYDVYLYIKHKIRGSNYADYYAERMDIRIRRNKKWGLNQDKSFQLNYLVKHGLEKSSDLLDYGAGAVAAGLHFIKYLDSDRYCGADISADVLEEGKARVAEHSLSDKSPKLVHIPSGKLENLSGKSFDFIWAQSVLTHMPPEAIEYLFDNMSELLKENGQFFANFKQGNTDVKHSNFRDWQYSTGAINGMAESRGLKMKVMDDWDHPYDLDKQDTMIRITLV